MANRKRLALLAVCLCLMGAVPAGQAASYYGRLHIPSVGIDVGLYGSSDRQAVVDRKNAACAFRQSYGRRTLLIADHYTQGFATLMDVTVGMTGHIEKADGKTVHIVCVEVLDGHNTGHGITDDHGISVVGQHDYLMYTCMGYWRNVRICQWDKIVKEDTTQDDTI